MLEAQLRSGFVANADNDAPEIGTLRYQEDGPAASSVPQNLAGLSFRHRAPASRSLFGPGALATETSARPAVPVGTILAQDGPDLGVLKYQPGLFTTGPIQEYRARRRQQDLVARSVLGILALAIVLPVGYLMFDRPGSAPVHHGAPIAAVAPLAPGAPAHVAPIPQARYVVRPGDVLGRIAERHHVRLEALLAANHLTHHSTIQIGQKLVIPAPAVHAAVAAPAPVAGPVARLAAPAAHGAPVQVASQPSAVAPHASLQHYRVPHGQHDPAVIAHRFGLSTTTLLAANRLKPGSHVRPGRLLIIPPADGYYHTVARGDTIGKFLRRRHIDKATFERFNPGVTRLHLGEVVFLPGDAPVLSRPHPTSRDGIRSRRRVYRTHRGLFGDLGRALMSSFRWPLQSHDITSPFGPRARDFHPGVDIAAPMGTPIHAARSGIVSRAGWMDGYGESVDIQDGGGIMTRYAHASKLLVHAGEHIHAGETIAKVGMTGDATGPHLHFEVRVNGRPVNPMRFYR